MKWGRASIGGKKKGKKKGKAKNEKGKEDNRKNKLSRISEGGEEEEEVVSEVETRNPGREEGHEGHEGRETEATAREDVLLRPITPVIEDQEAEALVAEERIWRETDESEKERRAKEGDQHQGVVTDDEGRNDDGNNQSKRVVAPINGARKFFADSVPKDSLLMAEENGKTTTGSGHETSESTADAKTTTTTTPAAVDIEKQREQHTSFSPPEILRRDAAVNRRFHCAASTDHRDDLSFLLADQKDASLPGANQDALPWASKGKIPTFPFKDVLHSTPVQQQTTSKSMEPVRVQGEERGDRFTRCDKTQKQAGLASI